MEQLHAIIGTDSETILWWQMVSRGVIIFFYTLLLIRLGGRRIFGKYTSFDIILAVILGSLMSRVITANASFFPTLATTASLVALHAIVARLCLCSRLAGRVLKGREVQIVEDGQMKTDVMRRNNLTENDLKEAMRSQGSDRLDTIKAAFLERNGTVSIISK